MFIDQIKPGARLQIQRPNDGPNEGFMCKVEVVLPDVKEVMVHAPISQGRIVKLPQGGVFNLRLLTDNAAYKYGAVLAAYTDIDGFDVIKFKLTTGGDKVQRRSAFRFNCSLNVEYSVVSQSGQQSDREVGLVRDLSAGGTKIYTEKSLRVGDLLNIGLQLGDELVVAFGDVRTKTDLPRESKYPYQYGIRFTMMPESDQEKIIRYMYKEQREALKKARPR